MRFHFRFVVLLLVALVLVGLCSCENSVTPPAAGKMHIFVYGNDYKYGVGGTTKFYYLDDTYAGEGRALQGTVNDALQVGLSLCALAQKAGYEYDGTFMLGVEYKNKVTDPNITVVENVLLDVFLTDLENLCARTSDEDITIFYFSGHGFGKKEVVEYGTDITETTYLGLRKIRTTSGLPDLTASVVYPNSNLLARIETFKGTKVILADFCYSGGLVQSGNVSFTPDEYTGIDATKLFFNYRNDIKESSSLFCLTAARYNELSYEPGGGSHGRFTKALLDAFGWDEETQTIAKPAALVDNYISLFNIANYVTNNDKESRQTPMVSGGSNDIILFSL